LDQGGTSSTSPRTTQISITDAYCKIEEVPTRVNISEYTGNIFLGGRDPGVVKTSVLTAVPLSWTIEQLNSMLSIKKKVNPDMHCVLLHCALCCFFLLTCNVASLLTNTADDMDVDLSDVIATPTPIKIKKQVDDIRLPPTMTLTAGEISRGCGSNRLMKERLKDLAKDNVEPVRNAYAILAKPNAVVKPWSTIDHMKTAFQIQKEHTPVVRAFENSRKRAKEKKCARIRTQQFRSNLANKEKKFMCSGGVQKGKKRRVRRRKRKKKRKGKGKGKSKGTGEAKSSEGKESGEVEVQTTGATVVKKKKKRVRGKRKRKSQRKGKGKEKVKDKALVFHGAAGTGHGSRIKGHMRRGGKWMRKMHYHSGTPVMYTNEHGTSKTCHVCLRRMAPARGRKKVDDDQAGNALCSAVRTCYPCPAISC
jgi:hypothetical protein